MEYYKQKKCFKIVAFSLCFFAFLIINCKKAYSLPIVNRIYGSNRYETSIKVSKQNWTTSDNVILVDGKGYADALCSAPLSRKFNAPIILINNEITNDVKNELLRLKAKKAYIIGGQGVISSDVEIQLRNIGLNYERIYGDNRYQTSIEIAKKLDSISNIFVVSGNNFPDALSVGSVAGINNMPIILVNNKNNEDIINFIKGKNVSKSYVIGGPSIIPEYVAKQFSNSERIYGSDRYATNYKIMTKFFNNNFNSIYIAYGQNFPDALSGTGAAIKNKCPIVLANKNLSKDVISYIKPKVNQQFPINILGGTSLISTSFMQYFSNGQTVCIDAGDGGADSGVNGINGVLEKDINLKVALNLGKTLTDNGIKVVYTRTTDKTLSEQQRINIANANKCDLLVSIHCNNFVNSTANGIETLYQSGSEISKNLSDLIQSNLIKFTGRVDRKSKIDTKHILLRDTYCASSMAMIGFLSNTTEQKLLLNSDYQKKCAEAIAQGIKEYLNKYPNSGKKIVSFKDIYKTINQGDSYQLPSSISALMSDNKYQQLKVTWNATSVNTNVAGQYKYIGSIDGCNKKVTLYLTIKGINITPPNNDDNNDDNPKPDTDTQKPADSSQTIVCVDPGHGGYDSGTVGAGTKEKDITLKVGLEVGRILSSKGIKVVYTRTSDVVSWPSNERQDLQKRCDIATQNNADYFVSIHCNSAMAAAHGIETYYCQSNNINDNSRKLAQSIQNELIRELSAVNRGVKSNVYYVNKNVDCPSILTEIGFLSNPQEGNLLKTPDYQKKVAHAIATGILNHLNN